MLASAAIVIVIVTVIIQDRRHQRALAPAQLAVAGLLAGPRQQPASRCHRSRGAPRALMAAAAATPQPGAGSATQDDAGALEALEEHWDRLGGPVSQRRPAWLSVRQVASRLVMQGKAAALHDAASAWLHQRAARLARDCDPEQILVFLDAVAAYQRHTRLLTDALAHVDRAWLTCAVAPSPLPLVAQREAKLALGDTTLRRAAEQAVVFGSSASADARPAFLQACADVFRFLGLLNSPPGAMYTEQPQRGRTKGAPTKTFKTAASATPASQQHIDDFDALKEVLAARLPSSEQVKTLQLAMTSLAKDPSQRNAEVQARAVAAAEEAAARADDGKDPRSPAPVLGMLPVALDSASRAADAATRSRRRRSSSSSSSSQHHRRRRSSASAPGIASTPGVVDEYCPLQHPAHRVVRDPADAGSFLHAVLHMQEPAAGASPQALVRFYLIQVLQHTHADQVYVFMRWGRIGHRGQFRVQPFAMDIASAVTFFHLRYERKTGNKWSERTTGFQRRPHRYVPVAMPAAPPPALLAASAAADPAAVLPERRALSPDERIAAMALQLSRELALPVAECADALASTQGASVPQAVAALMRSQSLLPPPSPPPRRRRKSSSSAQQRRRRQSAASSSGRSNRRRGSKTSSSKQHG